MKKTLFILLALAVLAGVFDSCMDVRRDNVPTFLSALGNWYIGGPEYSIPIWGPYDFWHFSKSCLMGTWVLLAIFSFRAGKEFPDALWWKIGLAALIIYWTQGLTFALFYHLVWRI